MGEYTSAALTLTKVAPLDDATAFTSRVFAHPGGPYSKSPRGGDRFKCAYSTRNFWGHSSARCSCCLVAV